MTPLLYAFFNYLPLKGIWPFNCTTLNSLYPRVMCTKLDWNWLAGSREKDFFFNINMQIFFPIVACADPQGLCFVQMWINIMPESFHVNMNTSGTVVLEKKIFEWVHSIFVIISPLKRTWPFICAIVNSLYSRITCTKFDWIGLLVLEKMTFFQYMYKHMLIWFSPLWPFPSPGDHDLKWPRYRRVISLEIQVGITSQINKWANTDPQKYWR
jgi:hypothetical protein